VVVKAGDQLTYYRNGVEASSGTITQALDFPQPLYFGGDNENAAGENWGGMMSDARVYTRALTESDIQDVMAGKGPNAELAGDPVPETEAIDVPLDTLLSWTPGEYAQTHDVYLGTVLDDVNDASRSAPMGVLISQGQTAASYAPDGLLELGQTYYWRIDEVNGAPDNTIFKGELWTFTAEPVAYPIEGVAATSNATSEEGVGPERTVDGSGLNDLDQHSTEAPDMWLGIPGAEPVSLVYEFDRVYKLHEMLIWNYNVQFELILGFGLKDVTVEYSEDGTEWTVLGDVQFAQATATADYTANTAVDFVGAAAKFVRLTVNSGFGMMGQYGLSEVRFLFIPAHAREPQPDDGAADVSVDTILAWRAGRDVVSHEVNFGTDPNALALVDTVDAPSFDPGTLDLGTTYYWKIDEVQETESWEGSLWSFGTQEFLVVDDFESYTDDEGSRIYETWIDGYGAGDNGSTVGHLESPFAETTIVNNGSQSMPLFYDNTGTSISEAELDLAQNWTTSGIKSFSLYFQGAAGNGGQLYVKINGTKVPYDGDASDIARAAWQPWNIDLSAVGGNLSNVTSLIVGVEGAGAAGVVYIDDVRLYPKEPEFITPADPGSDALVAYYAFDGDASDGSGNGNHGTLNGDPQFAGGHEGSALDCDGVDDYVSTGKSASDLGIGGNSPRTVSSWVYTRTFANGGIYDVGNRSATQDFCLRTYDSVENRWRIQYWGGDFDFTYDTVDKWVHFTHVHDGVSTKIYANGVLIVDWEKTIDTTDNNPFQIGCYGWQNDYFDGLIDEVRLYNQALSAGEALWLAGQTVPRHKPF